MLERNASTSDEFIQLLTPKTSGESFSSQVIVSLFVSLVFKPLHNDCDDNPETKVVEEAGISSRSFSGRVSDSNAGRNGKRGMVLPFQPLSLTFDEIRYSVDMPQVPYVLL